MARIRKRTVNLKKVTYWAIVVNAFQIGASLGVALLSLIAGDCVFNGWVEQMALFGMALIVGWGAVVDIREAYAARRMGTESDMLQDACEQLSELNGTLRAQRHDFMNHLQVVFGLIEMEEYKEARSYIEKVYGDIQRVGRVLKTAIPAVNALLAAKVADCEERGISVTLSVHSTWEGISVPDWEMCRVLGNLLDNAMDALKGTEKPELFIEAGEDLRAYRFCVKNNGPRIPDAMVEKIFWQGVTTKAAGHGMGLSIVREIMRSHGGEIRVESDGAQTAFCGEVPKGAETNGESGAI